MRPKGPLRKLKCPQCGVAFQTEHSHKKYCTPECQITQANKDQWERYGYDVTYRLKRLLGGARNRARIKNLDFDLDIDYLVGLWEANAGCCELTGREFDLSTPAEGKPRSNGASLDRIIPSRGYIRGNVRLIVYHMNVAINDQGIRGFDQLIQDYIDYGRRTH